MSERRRRGGRAAGMAGAALVVLGGSGCFAYVPTDFAAVPLGEGVRVYLSQTGMNRLREIGEDAIPGAASTPVLIGTLVRRDASEFSLQVPVGTRQVGFHSAELDQQVTLPVADVVLVERRKVSGARTVLLTAAGTAVVGAAIYAIIDGARRPLDNSAPDSDNVRVPLFSIPVP